jgi:internalin A
MPHPESPATDQVAANEALKRIGDCIRRRGTTLDLSHLGLSKLPDRIRQLTKLTELDLADNRFESLPAELLEFPALTRLDLSKNPLQSLPPEIGRFAGLTRLDLTHTPLAGIPPEIGQLTGLTRLYLHDNRLTCLPREIGDLPNLTRLYLAGNQLTGLPPEFYQLSSLTRLDLSNNRLAGLPPEIANLAKLTVLDVSHNPLGSLPPEIGMLPKLTVIHLSNTRLEALPAEFGRLANLTEIDLTQNPLTSLPESLRDLENLERLFLHDNPALQLSPSILGPDPRKSGERRFAPAKSILDFHFGRQSGKTRPLNEVKLVVLGRSGTGKTTLVQALRDQPFHDRETSTAGIAVSDWTIEGLGEPVTAHVWDFSGATLTHPLHPFFFSPGNIYIVVLTGKDQQEQADAEYWLRMIRDFATGAQGREAPVIVALNQWNVPGCRPEVDRIGLRERYPSIRGFVEMDCKAKKGIPALKAAISKELERMPWVREPVPEPWDAIRAELVSGNTSHGSLTTHGYREICAKHGVTDEGQQDYLAEILHQLGVVLNFRDDPRVDDAGVLHGEWLTRHLYPLLHRAELQSGILTRRDVDLTLLTEKDESARANLMQVMEKLGIAFAGQSANGDFWLLPHLQPATPPTGLESFQNDAEAIRIRFSYQVPGHGVIARLIARRFDFIDEIRDQKLHWRNGVILSRKGARALIVMAPDALQSTLTLTGPRKSRHQFADLCRAELRELQSHLAGNPVIEEIHSEGGWIPAEPATEDQNPANPPIDTQERVHSER